MKFIEVRESTDKAKKTAFPWLLFAVPIGCAIGIALRNLALGIGIGMLLGATVMLFRTKKDGENLSPVVRIAVAIVCVVVLAFVFFLKKWTSRTS